MDLLTSLSKILFPGDFVLTKFTLTQWMISSQQFGWYNIITHYAKNFVATEMLVKVFSV